MKTRKFLSTTIVLLCAAAGSSIIFAQGRYTDVYSRAQVEGYVRQLEASSDTFRVDFRREVTNSGLNNSTKRRYDSYAAQFENAVDRLRIRFDANDSWWESRNEVRAMISQSQNLNSTMNTVSFRRRLERQWNRLRDDINRLADTYDLPGLAGGGWTGDRGGGRLPGGNVPNWAVGTFYARNPNSGGTITMNIYENGNVTVNFGGGGGLTYATLRNRTLTVDSAVSRVTRLNNGIRTTRTDNGEIIDYFRGGPGEGVGVPDPGDIGRGRDVPNWAIGTFYGRNPQTGGTITLVVDRNGSVTVSFDNSAPSYATLDGTLFNYQGAQSRVTRLNNGIRTTRLDNGEVIDYYRTFR